MYENIKRYRATRYWSVQSPNPDVSLSSSQYIFSIIAPNFQSSSVRNFLRFCSPFDPIYTYRNEKRRFPLGNKHSDFVGEFWCIALAVEVIIVLVHEPDSFSTFPAQHRARNFPRSVDLVPGYSLAGDARSSRNILLFVNIDSRFLFIFFLLHSTLLASAEISSLRVWHYLLSWLKEKRETKRNEFALPTCFRHCFSDQVSG